MTTSRNGHVPLFTWDYLIRTDLNTIVDESVYTFHLANNIYSKLKELEQELQFDLKLFHNAPFGLNIRLLKPSDEVCYKYGLMVPAVPGDIAVLFIMPDKKDRLVHLFLNDYKNDILK